MFEGFDVVDLETPRGTIHARVGGDGPPVRLLHGYPETHLMWDGVAPALAERFTVVAADLPGHGRSFRQAAAEDHAPHSKRALADDLVEAMRSFGPFAVVGHDRGARVAYRIALDHRVTRLAVLDVVPTGEVWGRADATFALGYRHWAFLAQPAPLPERLIAADPDGFWIAVERMGMKRSSPAFEHDRVQLDEPGFLTAMCEDYRAGATIDRARHAEGGRIECPVRSLWGGAGALPRFSEDPLEPWRAIAPEITGRAVEGASHFLVEDAPAEVAEELLAFPTPERR